MLFVGLVNVREQVKVINIIVSGNCHCDQEDVAATYIGTPTPLDFFSGRIYLK